MTTTSKTSALRNTIHGTYKLFTAIPDRGICVETLNKAATNITNVEWMTREEARDEWSSCRASGSVPCAVPKSCE